MPLLQSNIIEKLDYPSLHTPAKVLPARKSRMRNPSIPAVVMSEKSRGDLGHSSPLGSNEDLPLLTVSGDYLGSLDFLSIRSNKAIFYSSKWIVSEKSYWGFRTFISVQ